MEENTLKKLNWIAHSENVFYANEGIFVFTKDMQNYLVDFVSKSEYGIARICAHNNQNDRLHEMVIVLKDSHYVPPHKHINKSESFHVIEGILGVIIFTDSGEINKTIILDTEKGSVFYRLSDELYHMVISLTPYTVFHEITDGPFKQNDSKLPLWAPNKNSDKNIIKKYHKQIIDFINQDTI